MMIMFKVVSLVHDLALDKGSFNMLLLLIQLLCNYNLVDFEKGKTIVYVSFNVKKPITQSTKIFF